MPRTMYVYGRFSTEREGEKIHFALARDFILSEDGLGGVVGTLYILVNGQPGRPVRIGSYSSPFRRGRLRGVDYAPRRKWGSFSAPCRVEDIEGFLREAYERYAEEDEKILKSLAKVMKGEKSPKHLRAVMKKAEAT